MQRRYWVPGLLLLLLIAGASTALMQEGEAVENLVTSADDSGPGTLRQIIADAGPGDTVRFDPSLIESFITLRNGPIVIDENVIIEGPGTLLVSGNDSSPVFRVRDDVTAIIGGLILLQTADTAIENDGTLILTSTTFEDNRGSAITNRGSTSISDSVFFRNDGGAVVNESGEVEISDAVFRRNDGTLIRSDADLTITSSTFLDNTGLVIENNGTLSVTDSTFVENGGAGVFSTGEVSVFSSTFSNNDSAVENDAGTLSLYNSILVNSVSGTDCASTNDLVENVSNLIGAGTDTCTGTIAGDPLLGPPSENGGPTLTMALQPGSVAIDAGTPEFCPAGDQRGVLRDGDNAPCDIGAYEYERPNLPTVTVATGDNAGPGSLRRALIDIADGGVIQFGADVDTVTLADTPLRFVRSMTVSGDVTIDGGDAPGSMVLAEEAIVTLDGLAIRGGGVQNDGTLTLQNATVRDIPDGAAITNNGTLQILLSDVVNNGLAVDNSGFLTIADSTVANNDTGALVNAGAAEVLRSTVAAHPGTAITNTGLLTLTNSTFTNNMGVAVESSSDLAINSSTLANNGGGVVHTDGVFDLTNSVLTGSSGADCTSNTPLQTNTANLISTPGDNCTGDVEGDPLLATLGENGGPTLTIPIQRGSAAVARGDDAFCLETDQRGIERPTDVACDLGAFQSEGLLPDAAVTGFTLVDAATGDAVRTIEDGDVLVIGNLPDEINIRVDTDPEDVGSVIIGYEGDPAFRVQNVPPFSLFGDRGGRYRSAPFFVPGIYTISATPYTRNHGQGEAGLTQTVQFTLIRVE